MVLRAMATEVIVSQKLMKNMIMWYALVRDSGEERRIMNMMRIEDAAERDPFIANMIHAAFVNMKSVLSNSNMLVIVTLLPVSKLSIVFYVDRVILAFY